jgi:serine/threonine protein kinase
VLGDLGSAWLRTSRGPAASLTPPYAAPEVWRGSSPTPEADVYSLALTMLYARTGQVPIAGNPPTPDDIVAAFPDLPIVLRALDPDARRRPRSVADLGRALRPGFFAGVAGGRVVTISLATPSTEPADTPS